MVNSNGVEAPADDRDGTGVPAASIMFTGSWGIIAAFTVLLGILGMHGWTTNETTKASDWVAHTYKVSGNLQNVLSVLQDAETGQRGYLLTRNDAYLEPFSRATAYIDSSVRKLRELTGDNQRQQNSIDRLEPLIADKLDELKATISLGQAEKIDEALAIVRSDRGKLIMDRVRLVIAEMEGEEAELLKVRQRDRERETTLMYLGQGIGVIVLIGIAWIVVLRIGQTPTIRRQAEEDVRQARDNLQNQVEERTRELTDEIAERKQAQTQLIQAAKLATLGEMSTSVAHELNQPLNVIRMAAGNVLRTVKRGDADPTYLNEKLERIQNQTERAAIIIDHMRMFGRKAEGSDEKLDPKTIISNTLDLMGEQLRLAEIEVVTEFPDDCSSIRGNLIQMEQVIINLMTNARDAIEDHNGEKKIILRVAEENGAVQLIVEDTGGGMPDDVMGRIFEPFYTNKVVGKGTGLGLSVSYGIIRDMDGTITASNAAQGARFVISLPKVDGSEQP